MLILLVLVLVLIFASLWDYKKRKIPNLLIAVGYIYGLMRIFYYQNFLTHIGGMVLPILILYPFFKIGTIGAGDIKLFSLIGCYLSFMEVLYCMFLTFVIGAIVSLVFMQREGNFADRISYLLTYLKNSLNQNQFRYYYHDMEKNKLSEEEISKTRIHLATPIFISVCIHFGGGFL